MNNIELLDKISELIYEDPLAQIRATGRIANTKIPLHCVMLVIDFDTERMMNGIIDYFGNSTGLYVDETIIALEKIGAKETSKKLSQISAIAKDNGIDYNSIQIDQTKFIRASGDKVPKVISWNELHGDKLENALDEMCGIDETIEESEMYTALENFINDHMYDIQSSMKKT